MSTAMILGIVVVGIILIGICILSIWKKVPQGKAAVITGLKKRVITGGGGIVIPCLERIDYISLKSMKLQVGTQGAMSSQGVPLNTDGVAIVKVKNDVESILAAMERFGNIHFDQYENGCEAERELTPVEATTKDVLEGKLREIVSKMTVEEIHSDREGFTAKVQEVAATQLLEMGLELQTLTIRNLDDDAGYLKMLGEAQIANKQKTIAIQVAEAKKETDIKVAEALKETQIQTSESKRVGRAAEIASETAISESLKEQSIKKLEFEKEVERSRAEKDASYVIQENITKKSVTETEMDAEVLKKQRLKEVAAEEVQIQIVQEQKRIELAEKKALRIEQELQETQIKPAEAEKQKQSLAADAKKYEDIAKAQAEAEAIKLKAEAEAEATRKRILAEAEAEAEAIKKKGIAEAEIQKEIGLADAEVLKQKGLAEATAIREKGIAEAEAMKEKAEAMKQYGEAAKLQIMSEILPQMAKNIAEPMASIDKIVCIGGGDGEGGAEAITKTVPKVMVGVIESIKETTGFDLVDVMKANTYDAKVNKNVSISSEQPIAIEGKIETE